MANKIPEKVQQEVTKQARKLRAQLFLGEEAPIGNDLPSMLQKLGITLLEYPIRRAGSNSFSAIFCQTTVDEHQMNFIGVNTCDFYDRQLFAIAHELYHFLNPSLPHISRDDVTGSPTEQRADWFAAELLLPLQVLKDQILEAFGKSNLNGVAPSALLRFIAMLQCTWWLPYKSIVHRLFEADAIGEDIYKKLFSIDERDPDGVYYRIGDATSSVTFRLLNEQTKTCGTGSVNLENCLRNYEDGIISEEELYDGLQLFGLQPKDFGISFAAEDEDEIGGGEDEC